jgi:hypothetical protein
VNDYDGFTILKTEELSASPGSFPGLKNQPSISDRNVWQGICNSPIPWDPRLAEVVRIQIDMGLLSPDPSVYIVPDVVNDNIRAEIKRFMMAILAYIKSPNPVIPLGEISMGILDRNFPSYLKQVRSKALILAAKGTHDSDPGPEYNNIPSYIIKDIGDIFNYKYWFNWEIEPGNDIEFSTVPVQIQTESLVLFKDAVRRLVLEVKEKGNVPTVDEYSISSTLSSSSSIYQGKRSKVWKDKEKDHSFSKSPLRGYLTYVQKGPCELREAVTLSVSQSNSVRIIDKQVYHIVKNMRHSAYNSDFEVFSKRLKYFNETNIRFFNRDLTKEGITKPRQLIHAMISILEEEFPHMPAWRYKGIYDNMYYILPDGSTKYTERGHGLGMANALTTLMQCATFEAYLQTLDIPDTISALFYNDDASIASRDFFDLDTYQDGEADFLASLGQIPKGTKTWSGRISILCEQYYPENLNVKASYKNYARLIPFASSCILTAKSVANLTLDPSYGEPRWDLFESLIAFFGLESGSVEEATTPYSCGGWLNLKYGGVDCSFLDYSESHPPLLVSQGAHIGPPKLKPPKFEKEKGKYLSPLERIYSVPPLPEHMEKRLMIRRNRSEVSAMFSRAGDSLSLAKWLKNEILKRRKEWKKKFPYLSWKEVITKVNTDSNTDILPPSGYIKEKYPEEVSIEGEGRYESTNPANSTFEFYRPGELSKSLNVVPWPIYDSSGSTDVTGSKLLQSETKNMFLPKGHPLLLRSPWVNDRILTNRCWKRPYEVWKVWIALKGNPTYPINPWPVQDALYNKEFEIYEAHIEKYWHVYQYVGKIPYYIARAIVRDPSIVDLYEEFKSDEVKKEREPPPEDGPQSFSAWMFSGRKPTAHPFQHIWDAGAEAIDKSNNIKSFLETFGPLEVVKRMEYKSPNEGFDSLMKNICGLDSYLDPNGLNIYFFKLAPAEESDNEEFFDIFGDG